MTVATFDADLFGTPSAVSVAPVPLPAALSLFLSGLGMLFARRSFLDRSLMEMTLDLIPGSQPLALALGSRF